MGSTTTQKESWDAYGTMVLTSGLAVAHIGPVLSVHVPSND
jgi:hypothetical protein